jgi:hypothetical protein
MSFKATIVTTIGGTDFYKIDQSVDEKDYSTGDTVSIEKCTDSRISRDQLVAARDLIQDKLDDANAKIDAVDAL